MTDSLTVTTWDDLARMISHMTPEQRQQPIQCVMPHADFDKALELLPGIAVGTVGELGIHKCRSVYDNRYHADDVVLLLDENFFAEDGAIAYRRDGMDCKPIYGRGGKTEPHEQCSTLPTEDGDSDVPVFLNTIMSTRVFQRWDDIQRAKEQS